MPLVLPVDEDAWFFRACLCVGMALLLLDVALPRLFRRRVRLVMPPRPRVLPPLPRARVMEKAQFRRRKRDLERQIRALESGDDAEELLSGADTASDREEEQNARVERRNRQRETPRDEEKRSAKATTKRASRVVLPGDEQYEERKENDVYVASASRSANRSASKRVSFDLTHNESETTTRASRQASPQPEEQATSSPVREPQTSATRPESQIKSVRASATEKARSPVAPQQPVKPSSRPDPFSLVDDDFPWQLPNYGTMGVVPTPSAAPLASVSSTTAQTHATSQLPQPAITLNVRRPLGQFNGPSAVSTAAFSSTLSAASTLELKHKPLWKRPTRETTENTAQSSVGFTQPFQSTTTAPSTQQPSNRYESSAAAPSPSLTSQLSVPFQKWRLPSPKPPRPPRQSLPTAAAARATSAADRTPVAAQSKLRTPKIIRRITFDEDMMGALATPSDASPFVTDSTRKRQRDQDVLEALDAVGLPWHKRRLNSGD